jgi:hypothetical protein
MLAFIFSALAFCLVFGGAFILLRTAKKPKIPKGFKKVDDEEEEEDSNGW